MAILRAKEIREMSDDQLQKQLKDLRNELLKERAITATGGAPENPGRIRELRRTIARILTIMKEEKK
ncbi:LSU ribosomal protein L29P [Methanocella conradii HZ254]|uniref:Large ribosomal subunit protein uL29 n=1 Tax=Methanocella conradii (strain DSM 24694 / JCM 17849 / CGMCC 1.5162 / HZ254) TaxID=1041930 RepID=H8IAI6_METCZ|nr:50S ribosomal protein L29 [Methanocella conradii]AFD00083.1 LSU ribosomal protein L29P [Methanocella conradii HZ254]MDI6896100.1 50S ribosomal protein L29 [Methanocella conradii]